jgi:VanZ family protein
VASSIPGETLSILPIFGRDKVLHMFEFGLLAFLLYRAFRFQTKLTRLAARPIFYATILTILYGPLDEFHQLLTPGRSFDPFDMIADMFGALAFVGIYRVVTVARRRFGRRGERVGGSESHSQV